jgi:hypothetical protein
MYTEKLKEAIGGIIGSFIMKSGEMKESDLESDLLFEIQNIFYLVETVTERKDFKEFLILGEKKGFFVYFHDEYMVGALLTHDANISLLSLMIGKILETPERYELQKPLPESHPSILWEQIPIFDQPKEEVLPNVPVYARQVLKFVDGIHTIKDILEESQLEPEVVLDVILAYRRTSVLHYK